MDPTEDIPPPSASSPTHSPKPRLSREKRRHHYSYHQYMSRPASVKEEEEASAGLRGDAPALRYEQLDYDAGAPHSPYHSPSHSPVHSRSSSPYRSPIHTPAQTPNNPGGFGFPAITVTSSTTLPASAPSLGVSQGPSLGPSLGPSIGHSRRGHSRATSSASAAYVPNTDSPPPMMGSPSRRGAFHFGSGSISQIRANGSPGKNFPPGGSPARNSSPGNAVSALLPKPSRRRGHHYQHSSVSMNMFKQPEKDQTVRELPLYPIPQLRQVISSISRAQRMRLGWGSAQLALAVACYAVGATYGIFSLQTLSHIVLYDAFGNLLTAAVSIMTNFPVWKSASLAYPFGLGRIHVLACFALSVSLVFVGGDLLSHVVEELITDVALGRANTPHAGGETSGVEKLDPGENSARANIPAFPISLTAYYAIVGLILTVSLISPRVLTQDPIPDPGSRAITSSAKRLSSITLEAPHKETPLHRWMATPASAGINTSTRVLTVLYSAYCFAYPWLQRGTTVSANEEYIELINECSTVILCLLILTFGYHLVKRLGNVLLLKSPPESLKHVITANLAHLDCFKPQYTITQFLISSVEPGIFVIIIRIAMPGASDDDEAKFRFYAAKVIRGIMQEFVRGNFQGLEGYNNPDRKSLVSLLNLDASTSEQKHRFEITVDVTRE